MNADMLLRQPFWAAVQSIQMLPFGGVAVIEDGGKLTAYREIVISLAGPLQNILMVGIVLLLSRFQLGDPLFLDYIIQANLLIALFNLLPVLPLDGERSFRRLSACGLLIIPRSCGLTALVSYVA